MEQVLRYTIPVLHPIVVHYPIALAALSSAAILVWLFRDRIVWLKAGLFIQAFGSIGSIVAFLSGEEMEHQSEGVPIVDELVHLHEDVALFATWVIGIALAAMVGAYLFSRNDTVRPGSPLWIRSLLFVLTISGAVLIAWTAHIGGTMVWGVLP